jgi:hypothetical protein
MQGAKTTVTPPAMTLLRQPLIRLLAVNLVAGAGVAVLMLGGLLALNPANLRGLILADRTPAAALALLAFGLLITFGSAAMGSAIMMLGARERNRAPGRKARAAEARLRAR